MRNYRGRECLSSARDVTPVAWTVICKKVVKIPKWPHNAAGASLTHRFQPIADAVASRDGLISATLLCPALSGCWEHSLHSTAKTKRVVAYALHCDNCDNLLGSKLVVKAQGSTELQSTLLTAILEPAA